MEGGGNVVTSQLGGSRVLSTTTIVTVAGSRGMGIAGNAPRRSLGRVVTLKGTAHTGESRNRFARGTPSQAGCAARRPRRGGPRVSNPSTGCRRSGIRRSWPEKYPRRSCPAVTVVTTAYTLGPWPRELAGCTLSRTATLSWRSSNG